MYVQSESNRIFAAACLEMRLGFHTEIYDYFEILYLKYFVFD